MQQITRDRYQVELFQGFPCLWLEHLHGADGKKKCRDDLRNLYIIWEVGIRLHVKWQDVSKRREKIGRAKKDRAQEPAQNALLLFWFWKERTIRDFGEMESRFLGNFAIYSSWLFVIWLAMGPRSKLDLTSVARRLCFIYLFYTQKYDVSYCYYFAQRTELKFRGNTSVLRMLECHW